MFCTLTTVCWMSPPDTTLSTDLMPWYLYLPASIVVFFNGTYSCVYAVCVCVCVCVWWREKGGEVCSATACYIPDHYSCGSIHILFLLTVQLLTAVCTVCVAHVCVYVCGGHWRRRHRPILRTAGDRKLLHPQSPGLPEARDHTGRSPCELIRRLDQEAGHNHAS